MNQKDKNQTEAVLGLLRKEAAQVDEGLKGLHEMYQDAYKKAGERVKQAAAEDGKLAALYRNLGSTLS